MQSKKLSNGTEKPIPNIAYIEIDCADTYELTWGVSISSKDTVTTELLRTTADPWVNIKVTPGTYVVKLTPPRFLIYRLVGDFSNATSETQTYSFSNLIGTEYDFTNTPYSLEFSIDKAQALSVKMNIDKQEKITMLDIAMAGGKGLAVYVEESTYYNFKLNLTLRKFLSPDEILASSTWDSKGIIKVKSE